LIAKINSTNNPPINPFIEVWSIAWPTILTMVSFTVMQFVDKLMVSKVGPLEVAAQGNAGTWSFAMIATVMGVVTVVNTYVSQNLGGPIAIASITREATDQAGWIGFWNITALLSITLAIINILPIPALDGGHLVFLIYEGVTRREPSEKVRMVAQQIGFFLMVALFIFVMFNDAFRYFGL